MWYIYNKLHFYTKWVLHIVVRIYRRFFCWCWLHWLQWHFAHTCPHMGYPPPRYTREMNTSHPNTTAKLPRTWICPTDRLRCATRWVRTTVCRSRRRARTGGGSTCRAMSLSPHPPATTWCSATNCRWNRSRRRTHFRMPRRWMGKMVRHAVTLCLRTTIAVRSAALPRTARPPGVCARPSNSGTGWTRAAAIARTRPNIKTLIKCTVVCTMLCLCRRFPANESVAVIWICRKIQISVGGHNLFKSMQTLYGTDNAYRKYNPLHNTYYTNTPTYCCPPYTETYRFKPNTCCSPTTYCPNTLVSQQKPCFAFVLSPCTPRYKPQFDAYLSTLVPNETVYACPCSRLDYYNYSFGKPQVNNLYASNIHIPKQTPYWTLHATCVFNKI